MGSDQAISKRLPRRWSFNPRSRVGSDQTGEAWQQVSQVSIHAPAWGATELIHAFIGNDKFQSTLPRGERRESSSTNSRVSNVSIHAPAWGATASTAADAPATIVSIHAPAWGATNLGDDITMRLMFQSTLPRGERRLSDGSREFSFEVSIHAPAWGATAVIV